MLGAGNPGIPGQARTHPCAFGCFRASRLKGSTPRTGVVRPARPSCHSDAGTHCERGAKAHADRVGDRAARPEPWPSKQDRTTPLPRSDLVSDRLCHSRAASRPVSRLAAAGCRRSNSPREHCSHVAMRNAVARLQQRSSGISGEVGGPPLAFWTNWRLGASRGPLPTCRVHLADATEPRPLEALSDAAGQASRVQGRPLPSSRPAQGAVQGYPRIPTRLAA